MIGTAYHSSMPVAPLNDWENFYVITGSAAAGLTGLTFVVIALVKEAQRVDNRGLRAFVTPTIVHFSTVLGLAAFLCMPRLTVFGASLGLGGAGVLGLVYVVIIAADFQKLGSYIPVREDWIWNAILPGLAYGALLGMAFLIWRRPVAALYAVAAASMLILFVGIHNAWDIAVWMSQHKKDEKQP
jgi:hypothetical protein